MTNQVRVMGSKLGRKYAWKRDLPDQRDMMFSAPLHVSLPSSVDISTKCSAIEDQGNLGSCTAHALGPCLEFITGNADLSRLFIYWNERYIEGDVSSDAGAMIRTGAKVCAKLGAPVEKLWPYITTRFRTKPPIPCFTEALNHTATQYTSVYGLLSMKACLAQGFPFAIGISVYDSFETDEVANTGIVPLPKSDEQNLGGHAICAVGYNDSKGMFKMRNSWGTGWGLKGYFWIPYSYLSNTRLAGDAWTLRRIKS